MSVQEAGRPEMPATLSLPGRREAAIRALRAHSVEATSLHGLLPGSVLGFFSYDGSQGEYTWELQESELTHSLPLILFPSLSGFWNQRTSVSVLDQFWLPDKVILLRGAS